jgi:hypothetical protein
MAGQLLDDNEAGAERFSDAYLSVASIGSCPAPREEEKQAHGAMYPVTTINLEPAVDVIQHTSLFAGILIGVA